MGPNSNLLTELNQRSREVFRRVVEAYLESGDPVGSRTLTRGFSESISAATIRNVMQDLEFLGLLNSPHVSAGRIPTQLGLRMFVDGILELGAVTHADREILESTLGYEAPDMTATLDRVGAALSGITRGASIVVAPKHDEAEIRHIEFVNLGPDRALVVLVLSDGQVENRVFTPPPGLTPSAMREAANLLNALAGGKTLSALRSTVRQDLELRRREIDALAQALVESGIALWENAGESGERLIVRGRANLLDGTQEADDLERVRRLFDDLERTRDLADFLDLTEAGDGVKIFIGSENKLFSLSGSSLVVSPYMNADRKIIGAVGVIGPTRLNYGRVVPVVDYTAQLVSRLMSDRNRG
ncbi:heat-inducible transcriptional repressor HrcA [Gemmobacter lutimaris]|uniref:Heat-inducible transcription repressor HrcA n=1 Tax=Gemmobacter lutimaris TaxID=2306023 RepID=A0A398BMW5_9RHOB|nr:heat-inducible transcriptional repressor HrcA [Gemmobacter lutimaris]RID90937.1 heat-inducible transcriptional repressor HrcA [Gemmobacter lutimaris]